MKLLAIFIALLAPVLAQTAGVRYLGCTAATASGTAYACSISPAISGLVVGTIYRLGADVANTGGATVEFNGLGQKIIKMETSGGANQDLTAGCIQPGQYVYMTWDGTYMQALSTACSSGGGGGTTVSANGWYLSVAGTNYITPWMVSATPFVNTGFSSTFHTTTARSVGGSYELQTDGGQSPHLYSKAFTFTGTQTLTAWLGCQLYVRGFVNALCGVALHETATGKSYTWQMWEDEGNNGRLGLAESYFLNSGGWGYVSDYYAGSFSNLTQIVGLRLVINSGAGTVTAYYSVNGGLTWINPGSSSRNFTTLFTTAPDRIGIVFQSSNSTAATPEYVEVLSWSIQ